MRTYKRVTLKSRIFLIGSLSVIFSVAAILVSSIIIFNKFTGDTMLDQNRFAVHDYSQYLDDCLSVSMHYAGLVARNPVIIEGFSSGDSARLLSDCRKITDGIGFEFATLADASGKVLCRTHSDKRGDSVLSQDNVKSAVAGVPLSAVEPGTVIKISARSGFPVFAAKGNVIGAVSIGFQGDSVRILNQLKKKYSVEVSVFYQGKAVMSTLTDKPELLETISALSDISSLMKSAVQNPGDIRAVSSTLMGNRYLHSYWPVKDSSGKSFAGVLVSNSYNNARAAVVKMIVIGCLLSVVLFIAVIAIYSYLMRKQLFTPLNKVVTAFGEMGRGELNKTIEENDFHTVELYNLALAYNKLNKNVSEIIHSIKVFADSLISSADEFSVMSRDLAESTQGQSAAVEESSAALEEISGSVEHIAVNVEGQSQLSRGTYSSMLELRTLIELIMKEAGQSLEIARSTGALAVTGSDLMMNTVSGMDTIKNSTDKIAENINIITEISDHVNLLALNASIEAARAGDQGKGFAVVAEEIGKLADQTAESAKTITELVREGEAEVKKGREYALSTSSVIEKIILSIDETNDIIKRIHEISSQQNLSSSTVLDNTKKLDEMCSSISFATSEQMTTNKEMITTIDIINNMTQTVSEKAVTIDRMANNVHSQVGMLKTQLAFFNTNEKQDE